MNNLTKGREMKSFSKELNLCIDISELVAIAEDELGQKHGHLSEALELLSKLEELLFKKRQKKHQVKKCRPEVGLNSGRLQVKQTLILAKPLSARELIMNDLKKRGYDTSKVEIVTCGNKNENS